MDFGLEFALPIARWTLEQRLLAELEEKDGIVWASRKTRILSRSSS